MRNYVFRKITQLKNISWFLGGFFFGSNLSVVSIVCLVLAVLLDFLSSVIPSSETPRIEA